MNVLKVSLADHNLSYSAFRCRLLIKALLMHCQEHPHCEHAKTIKQIFCALLRSLQTIERKLLKCARPRGARLVTNEMK